ncbi:MAG TPA: hypothetical protein PK131_01300 [Candidatus Woesebacteria bacterium]|nr:hypothetical protein [Candidatus Woesebacteria bacterium]HRT40111.1 hypothetical protein [Candidatus Woesebacteria bacterium]
MSQFNLTVTDIATAYERGLLPQRNNRSYFYRDTACRSNLANFSLSSENRRILKKTQQFSFRKTPLKDFKFDLEIQKQIYHWTKTLKWNFPISSVKNVFTNHFFNYLYDWTDNNNQSVAYAICYFSTSIAHIAYVFYNPRYNHSDLPIRLVLQVVIDSHDLNLTYCYLGRFSTTTGYYKRAMPGFEYFSQGKWKKYN